MEAEEIAQKARKKIGKFCFEECGAYCCRKGYLVLNDIELALIKGTIKEQNAIKILEDGRTSLFLGAGCPALKKNFQCKIHKNVLRPLACKEFPIFVKEKEIHLSGRCLAIKQGKLYPYIKQWLNLGYKIYESSDSEGFDLRDTKTS